MQGNFGIEIEFIRANSEQTREEIAVRLSQLGINTHAEGYNHYTRDHWKLITDSSADYELVSPVLNGERGIIEMKRALDALDGMGCKVNKTCGIHIHLDANSLNVEQIKAFCAYWSIFQAGIFDNLVPYSRRSNHNYFCQNISSNFEEFFNCNTMVELADLVNGNTRYKKLNLKSYFRYGTLEIRHHGGSLNSYKVEGWLRLQYTLLQYAIAHPSLTEAREISTVCDRDKLNNIVRFDRDRQPRSCLADLKLRQIKELVYNVSGCSTTKKLKKMFARHLDLRKRSSWISLYNSFTSNFTGSSFDLEAWVNNRTSQLQTTIAAG